MKLFLDDERDPVGGGWVIVRSYNDAVTAVASNGFPDFVSFDHDLGTDKSGYDFAHYLIDRDLSLGDMPKDFDFQVHSMNPVGAENIKSLMDNYIEFKKKVED